MRFCVFSPTGLNIAAQGKAKRRPGYAIARNAHCPEGAEQTVPTHTKYPNEFCPFRAISHWRTHYPGRRSSLCPGLNCCCPIRGESQKPNGLQERKAKKTNCRKIVKLAFVAQPRLCLPILRLFALGVRCGARQCLGSGAFPGGAWDVRQRSVWLFFNNSFSWRFVPAIRWAFAIRPELGSNTLAQGERRPGYGVRHREIALKG